MKEVNLIDIKSIDQATRVGLPIDQTMKDFLKRFDDAHKAIFKRSASKQQVLYLMIEIGKVKVEKLVEKMEKHIKDLADEKKQTDSAT